MNSVRAHAALLAALLVMPACARYDVSGTITASAETGVDADTNDEMAPFAPNDGFDTAQPIEAPISLGGYANVAGAGPPGRSQVAGDRSDFYRVHLETGQRIDLSIGGNGFVDDLDLFLYGPDRTLVDHADSTSPSESLPAPADDDYFVEIYAYAGAASYVLEVGLVSTPNAVHPPARFVPGEVIVRGRLTAPGTFDPLGRSGPRALYRVAGAPEHEMLLRFADLGERSATFRAFGAAHLATDWSAAGIPADTETATLVDTARLAKRLRSEPGVHSADLNYLVAAHAVPGDPLYDAQWHYRKIGLEEAWDAVPSESSVVVAVLDTGVVLDHPDLDDRLLPGFDFISNSAIAADGDGLDPDPSDPGDQDEPDGSSSFHGTHVAGTVAAETTLGGAPALGVAGVAWNARIVPLRVLGVGGGTSFDSIQALRFAGGLGNASGLTREPVDVVNMSFGCLGCRVQAFQDAIHEVRANGTIVVASAGNDASSSPAYPAAYDGVVSVAATDDRDRRLSFSNYGPQIDVAAPGASVTSTSAGDAGSEIVTSYGIKSGTSMSAPHVAGVAALMRSIDPDLSPRDFDDLLAAGALTVDLGIPGRDDSFGYGRIDAAAAVAAAEGGVPPSEPHLELAPPTLDLGLVAPTAAFTAYNAGPGDLAVLDVAAAPPEWLDVVPLSVDGNGLGIYSVRVERAGLAPGIYEGSVTVTSSQNAVVLPVTVAVGAALGTGGNAGYHWVVLADPVTLDDIYTVGVGFADGRYEYRFEGVSGGDYLLFAGSDHDQDFWLCHRGEACGAYPALGYVGLLTIDADLTGLDFTTQLLTETPSGFAGGVFEAMTPTARGTGR